MGHINEEYHKHEVSKNIHFHIFKVIKSINGFEDNLKNLKYHFSFSTSLLLIFLLAFFASSKAITIYILLLIFFLFLFLNPLIIISFFRLSR